MAKAKEDALTLSQQTLEEDAKKFEDYLQADGIVSRRPACVGEDLQSLDCHEREREACEEQAALLNSLPFS